MKFKKIIAAAMIGMFLSAYPAIAPPDFAFAAKKKSDAAKKKAPKRQKGGKAEALTYERAMEIENKRHEKNLADIKRFYRHHKPMKLRAIKEENDFHAKRVAEIQKRFGMI